MLNPEAKAKLAEARRIAYAKQKAEKKARQIELCYRVYSPPQVTELNRYGNG